MTFAFDDEDARYFNEVLGRREQAVHPEVREVVFRSGQSPAPNDCHANAARWASETPGMTPVHGWLIQAQDPWRLHLVAHSLVQDRDGALIEITPLNGSTGGFLRHEGAADAFFQRLPHCNVVSWPVVDLSSGSVVEGADRPFETFGI